MKITIGKEKSTPLLFKNLQNKTYFKDFVQHDFFIKTDTSEHYNSVRLRDGAICFGEKNEKVVLYDAELKLRRVSNKSNMKPAKYYGVRKVEWDVLWHGLYHTKSCAETWDRISGEDAQKWLKSKTNKCK